MLFGSIIKGGNEINVLISVLATSVSSVFMTNAYPPSTFFTRKKNININH